MVAAPARQCQRSRLALRCEPTWGGQHDLKTLAAFKGRNKRLVWLENDAASLLHTMRNLRQHALNYKLVHLLWDPLQACKALWPMTLAPNNVSIGELCYGMRMDALPTLYKRARRDRARVIQPRLEELVTKKAGLGASSWRQCVHAHGASQRASRPHTPPHARAHTERGACAWSARP